MPRILLIEPDVRLASSYAAVLTAVGYAVTHCVGAQAAVSVADEAGPDVVIMELQLAGHNGLEFLHEFRSYTEWWDVPVIVQTTVPPGEFADNQAALTQYLGIKAYLYKPQTSLRQLLRTVRKIIPTGTPA